MLPAQDRSPLDAAVRSLADNGFEIVQESEPGARPDLILIVAANLVSAVEDVRRARQQCSSIFIVVVFEHDELAARLKCYESGADDCVFKPFHLTELFAKFRAFQRRLRRSDATKLLKEGAATVDGAALELRMADRVTGLTRREADLLALLAKADGAPVRREDILRDAWKAPSWMTNNSVDVYVGYARRKLALLEADVTIATVRGIGFQIIQRTQARRSGKIQYSP